MGRRSASPLAVVPSLGMFLPIMGTNAGPRPFHAAALVRSRGAAAQASGPAFTASGTSTTARGRRARDRMEQGRERPGASIGGIGHALFLARLTAGSGLLYGQAETIPERGDHSSRGQWHGGGASGSEAIARRWLSDRHPRRQPEASSGESQLARFR